MPFTAAQRMAAAHERQRQDLEAPAIRLLTVFARHMVVEAIKTFRAGGSVYPAIHKFTGLMGSIFYGALIAAHLQGRIDARTTAAAALAARAKKKIAAYSDFGPYDKAVEALKAREQLTSRQLSDIEKLYGDTATSVTRKLGRSVEVKCQTAAGEILSEGMHINEATARMRQAFKAAGVLPQVVVDGQTRPAIFLLETLARTQVQLAYGAGRWNANQDSAIQEILWGYEYSAVMDDRTRPEHAALDGLRAPKDDPIWKRIWPPNGFCCRCTTIEIFDGDKQAEEFVPEDVDGKTIADATQGGWGYNAGEIFVDNIVSPEPPTSTTKISFKKLPPPEPKPDLEIKKIAGVGRIKKLWQDALDVSRITHDKKTEYSRNISTVFNRIPAVHRENVYKNLNGFKLHGTTDDVNKAYNRVSRRRETSVVGFYNIMLRTIDIDGGGGTLSAREIYAHELCHAVDHNSVFSGELSWKLVWRSELADGQLTNYASSNPTEGLAEFSRFLWTTENKDQLKSIRRQFPDAYAFCKRNKFI